MKPIEFSQAEVALLRSMLTQRRESYVDQTDNSNAPSEQFFRKKTEELDALMSTLSEGDNYLGSNAKVLLKGCMNEFLMDSIRRDLGVADTLSQPELYRHYRTHKEQLEQMDFVLGLWNKLVKKDETYPLPSEFMAMMDKVFEAQLIYASFSELKPYKVAFFRSTNCVYRLSLDSEREEIQGPYEYTKKDLEDVFMKSLSCAEFGKALRAYGKKTPLNGWHTLLLEKMDVAPVEM